MPDLSSAQFKTLSTQLGQMDRDYPTPAPRDGQFFHGTVRNIRDKVLPADTANVPVSDSSMGDPGDLSEGDHAFAIRNDENYAWHAANTFHHGGRSRVYEVDPAPDMKPGPWNKDHPDFLKHHELDMPEGVEYDHDIHAKEVAKAVAKHQDEWASPTGFPVRKRIDIMPGRQGTFPNVNWSKYQTSGFGQEANHPTDMQAQYGQRWSDMLEKAKKEDAARTPEPKRTGSRLRAFMMGQPDPGPLADHPKLF